MPITGDFERFQYFKTGTIFSKKLKPFLKSCSTVFELRILRLKVQIFHTKLSCQKPMLRQIEWRVQNVPITKNEVLTFIYFLEI